MNSEDLLKLLDTLLDEAFRLGKEGGNLDRVLRGDTLHTAREGAVSSCRARVRYEIAARCKDFERSACVSIWLNSYQLANLRWLFRQAWRFAQIPWHQRVAAELTGGPPARAYQFDTGDWFGEMAGALVEIAKRAGPRFLDHAPNTSEGDGPTAYDREVPPTR